MHFAGVGLVNWTGPAKSDRGTQTQYVEYTRTMPSRSGDVMYSCPRFSVNDRPSSVMVWIFKANTLECFGHYACSFWGEDAADR